MTNRSFYSDRSNIARLRVLEHIPDAIWSGLVALVDIKIDNDWLAREFPDPCPDGRGVAGTNRQNLRSTMNALIPGLDWPPDRDYSPETHVALDLVDFVAQRVAKPKPARYHDFFHHYELEFDVDSGRRAFRKEVNQIFARGGVAFELNRDMKVVRLGPPEARQVLADLRPESGDPTLDELILDGRRRYLSRDSAEERIGLEKLWDAFERLKTIEDAKDKKGSVRLLLDRVATGPIRDVLERESLTLTEIGNTMQIRHFESDKIGLTDAQIDYLFVRMSDFLVHVLRMTGRLRDEP